jgi:ABC-type polysaccharide/polyol phosphate transport system ATPase subunit
MIHFSRVSKSFRHSGGSKLLRAHVIDYFRNRQKKDFFALRDVSFSLRKGESLGVIGRNGAGKSTLLSLVAGLAQPTEGRVTINGRVAALLALGAGFHPELTGEENLRLNASLLGLTRKRTNELHDDIIAFADIGDFIREPIRTYSTGMMMRLAFSVAVNVDPDILILDEVFAVGDQEFQNKCFERIRRFRAEGKTLLFVSHSTALVREICDRALWLTNGEVTLDGPVGDVLEAYSDTAAHSVVMGGLGAGLR